MVRATLVVTTTSSWLRCRERTSDLGDDATNGDDAINFLPLASRRIAPDNFIIPPALQVPCLKLESHVKLKSRCSIASKTTSK